MLWDFSSCSRPFSLPLSINFPSLPPFLAAPSTVPIMHQVSATMRSITLSWPQPEQPNGIILDYEIRYYEKLSRICTPDVGSTVGSRPAPVSPGGALPWGLGWGMGARAASMGSETGSAGNGHLGQAPRRLRCLQKVGVSCDCRC